MTISTKLTLEAFLKRAETKPASEYIDGEVVRKPMPTGWHGLVQRLLSYVFTLYMREHPGEAGPEIRCVFDLPDHQRAYVPDFVYIAAVRVPGGIRNAPFYGAPDLAVEILSPSDRATRLRRKVRFYLEHGVRLVWVIDPEDRTVTVMTSPVLARTLSEDETLDGGDVLPGFSVLVRDILPPADQSSPR